jgi:solute carrier family 8 (sodium/calcium exchanger)
LIAFNENQVEALIDINLPQLKKESTDVKSLTLVATLSSPNQAELSQ